MYAGMDEWRKIGYAVLREGQGKRKAERETGMHRRTLEKVLPAPGTAGNGALRSLPRTSGRGAFIGNRPPGRPAASPLGCAGASPAPPASTGAANRVGSLAETAQIQPAFPTGPRSLNRFKS